MEAKAIPGLCRFLLPRPSRATRIPAPVIVTSSFSTIRIVFSTSFLALVFLEIPGTQAPRQSGIFLRTSSGLTLGRARTLLDCRFSLGLLRYDEAAAGQVHRAFRFTPEQSRAAFIPPASHWAANSSNALAAPMGMRVRLKAGYDVSPYSATNQVILNTLKKFGMIMADNGSNMFLSGVPADR